MFLALVLSGNALAADLIVVVIGLRSAEGTVHVALYDKPDSFPKSGEMLIDRVVPAAPDGSRAVFAGMAPGTYAVAVYHDENGNGDFDQGFLGIPLEGYAFSNGATVFFGPPGFDEAAFEVGPGDALITIPIGY